ncbi:MAG: hypothetical protein HC926_05315 [Synechococcaceae cyanobacterium SM2_3_60]|nr:hypothetical protein [Synechococcaceae cyanobacterium SM2_3_60]
MSTTFRSLLRKVGSGTHTHTHLSRAEAQQAIELMLGGEATPAQIGAFLIAHRIKRPTIAEMGGILDAYAELGPQLDPIDRQVCIFGHPYDGRDRTSPVAPLVALILATAGVPVLQHGAGVCPTKYGVPLVKLWQALGIDWTGRNLTDLSHHLKMQNLSFVYMPEHFAAAQTVMNYRDEIGKRPPLATAELLWTPYAGPYHLIAGFVHPPTEAIMQALIEAPNTLTTVKGLEGSCDLPRSRTVIMQHKGERLFLKAKDYDLEGSDVAYPGLEDWQEAAQQVLAGHSKALLWADVIWNAGVYLWLTGVAESVAVGIAQATDGLITGQVEQYRQLVANPQ